MANEEWDSIDKINNEFDEVYCAFIDILGYKNKVDDFFNNKYNLMGRIERAMTNANIIDDIANQLTDKRGKELIIFSDSIVIAYPYNNNGLLVLLHDIQNISAQLSMENIFVRGGISKGKHLSKKLEKSNFPFLASEALANAYALEQDKERKPRVLVDNKIIKNIEEVGKNRIVKEDNKYFVNFASILIKNNPDHQAVKLELEDISKNICNTNKRDINEKYMWLLDYYYWSLVQDRTYNILEFEKFKSKEYNQRNFELA